MFGFTTKSSEAFFSIGQTSSRMLKRQQLSQNDYSQNKKIEPFFSIIFKRDIGKRILKIFSLIYLQRFSDFETPEHFLAAKTEIY